MKKFLLALAIMLFAIPVFAENWIEMPDQGNGKTKTLYDSASIVRTSNRGFIVTLRNINIDAPEVDYEYSDTMVNFNCSNRTYNSLSVSFAYPYEGEGKMKPLPERWLPIIPGTNGAWLADRQCK